MQVFIPVNFIDCYMILTQQKRNYALRPANVAGRTISRPFGFDAHAVGSHFSTEA